MSNTSIRSLLLRIIFAAALVCVFFLTVIVLVSDFDKVKSTLQSISLKWFLPIIIAVLFNYTLRFVKWNYFLHLLEIHLPIKQNIWIFFSAFTMALSPGKIGELVKSLLIKSRFDIPVAKTAPVIMAERITDLIGLLILGSIGFYKFGFGGKTLVAVASLIILGIVVISRPKFWEWIRNNIAKISWLASFEQSIVSIESSTKNLLSLKSIIITTPLSAVSWAGEGVALFLIFKAMGTNNLPDLIFISLFAHAFSSIVGALSFIPGGLLATESSMGLFFVYVSIPKEIAISATFAIRAVTLWFAIMVGTIVFLMGHTKQDLEIFKTNKKQIDRL